MAWLNRMPIKRRLVAIMLLVMTASFAVSVLINGIYGYRSDRRAMERHLQILASAIGDNCAAALVFEDEDAAAEILSALQFDESITAAVLTDVSSVTVASFQRAGSSAVDGRKILPGENLRVDRAISLDGKTVGYLTIRAETDAMLSRSAMEAIVAVTAFVFGVLVLLSILERMQRVLVAPLVDLHETIRRVVRSRNYSVRASRATDDEVDDIALALNDLLAQVEAGVQRAPDTATTSGPAAEAQPAVDHPALSTDAHRVR